VLGKILSLKKKKREEERRRKKKREEERRDFNNNTRERERERPITNLRRSYVDTHKYRLIALHRRVAFGGGEERVLCVCVWCNNRPIQKERVEEKRREEKKREEKKRRKLKGDGTRQSYCKKFSWWPKSGRIQQKEETP